MRLCLTFVRGFFKYGRLELVIGAYRPMVSNMDIGDLLDNFFNHV